MKKQYEIENEKTFNNIKKLINSGKNLKQDFKEDIKNYFLYDELKDFIFFRYFLEEEETYYSNIDKLNLNKSITFQIVIIKEDCSEIFISIDSFLDRRLYLSDYQELKFINFIKQSGFLNYINESRNNKSKSKMSIYFSNNISELKYFFDKNIEPHKD